VTSRLARAMRSEWVKLLSSRALSGELAGILVAMVLLTSFLAAVGHTDATRAGQGDDDVVVDALRGVYMAQSVAVVFGAAFITSEFATRMIRATLTATPRRGVVFVVKAVVVAGTVWVVGTVACLASFLVAQPLLHGGGFVPPAYPFVSLADPGVLRAVLGTGLYLTLVALMAYGIGVLIRDPAAALTVALGLLLVPTVLAGFTSGHVSDLMREVTPIAGLAVQSVREGSSSTPPIGSWAGIAVTGAWTAAALSAAYVVVRARDV
jgi:ABC-2 family transporter protein